MGQPKRASAKMATTSAKRPKLDVGPGDELVVKHNAPRTKRMFADMCGTVISTTGSTVDLRFSKIPRQALALYSDYVDAEGVATVRFSL